ncbi:MAG: DUF1206 domain-containing protein [Actinomycetota bacterium]
MTDSGTQPKPAADRAVDKTERVADSKQFERVARTGFVASGLLHVLIGAIALRLAFGGSGQADQSGAASGVAQTPGGLILLWAGMLGAAALALWQVSEAVFGRHGWEKKKKWGYRAKSVGLAIVYGAVAASFGSFALGSGGDSSQSSQDASTKLMQWPGGAVVLFLIGAVIIGIGIYYAIKGLFRNFLSDLKPLPLGRVRTAVTWVGIVGFVGKGLALFVLGLLLAVAAVQNDPQDVKGLDGALKALREQPLGPAALAVVAVGLICYGLYLGARARYAKM